jgi:DNA-binding NtrC family response regulator
MKILLVEDDPHVAHALVQVLAHLGHEGVAVERIAEAVALFEASSDIEAAIVDIGLRDGEDGHDLLRWLAEHRPQVRRILTSGFGRPEGFVEDPPRQLFLGKPFGVLTLKALFGG